MSDVNLQQVGGTHYQSLYNHWDWVLDTDQSYLAGNASKYVSRWRKKNGLEDLQKALHYINKLHDCFLKGRVPHTRHSLHEAYRRATLLFVSANNLGPQEVDVCLQLVTWTIAEDLFQARDLVLALMEQADQHADAGHDSQTGTWTVPLEDGNKHAERVERAGLQAAYGKDFVGGDK